MYIEQHPFKRDAVHKCLRLCVCVCVLVCLPLPLPLPLPLYISSPLCCLHSSRCCSTHFLLQYVCVCLCLPLSQCLCVCVFGSSDSPTGKMLSFVSFQQQKLIFQSRRYRCRCLSCTRTRSRSLSPCCCLCRCCCYRLLWARISSIPCRVMRGMAT